MSFFDKVFPFFVGNRTEILGMVYTVLRLLGVFGVIDPAQADAAGDVLRPAMMTTAAAKLGRTLT